jgi:hypothetical protein
VAVLADRGIGVGSWGRRFGASPTSAVDPDPVPVGFKTFSRIRIWIWKKSFWFRIRAALDPGSSGSGQLWILNEFEVKLLRKSDKILQFLEKR